MKYGLQDMEDTTLFEHPHYIPAERIVKSVDNKLKSFQDCKKAWRPKKFIIDGKYMGMGHILRTDICVKCFDLNNCQARINVVVNERFTGKP